MLIGIDASRAFSPFVGGPENYSYYLIRAILRASSDFKFRLYLRPNSNKSPRYDKFVSGLKIENCELKIVNWPYLWTQGGLALECLLNPPDVLFVPAHTIPIIRSPKLKTVVTIHDLGAEFLPNYHKFPQKYYLNFATEFAINNATRIVAVSQYTKRDILRRFQDYSPAQRDQNDSKPSGYSDLPAGGIGSNPIAKGYGDRGLDPNDGISVVYEGFDREVFYPRNQAEIAKAKSKYGIEGGYFLFVGTIQPRKNLVRLIEAYSKLLGNRKGVPLKGDPFPKLVLAGAPGWLYEEIYQAPEKFGVWDRVRFIGHVGDDDLPVLLSGCRAFVFPSLYEGFGLSLLEAMACGVPVITSNVASLPEVGGEAPFYVDPLDVVSVSEGLQKVLILSDEEEKQKRQLSLKQAEKFSWEKSANEILSLLDNI